MRVIQRLMGVENPVTQLKVYEHTLHFRQGVAVIDDLTEREINRLRAFGFRVERDAVRKKSSTAPAPVPPVSDPPEAAPTGPKRAAPKKKEEDSHATTV